MKIRYYIYLLLFALVIVSCEDTNSYHIKGNIKGLQSAELYVVSSSDLKIDTIRAKSGKFSYRGVSSTVEPLVIYMDNGNTWMTLWVQNGDKISLSGDVNYPELIMAKGGEINKLITEFKTENLSLIKEKCELRDKIHSRLQLSPEPSQSSDVQFSLQIKNLDQILKTRAQDFVEAHPASIASLVMIQDYILDVDNACAIQPFLNILSEEVKANSLYGKLNARCLNDLQIKAGQPALNFKLMDTKNDSISLSTFKDKYLILTFAASDCYFCETEYTELLAIQDSFPSKELAILTISLDENKVDWKKLAQDKGINWFQVIDSAGWNSPMVSLYNVLTIPCNYLIDKDGIIIGSKLTVENIQTMLNEKLKKINRKKEK